VVEVHQQGVSVAIPPVPTMSVAVHPDITVWSFSIMFLPQQSIDSGGSDALNSDAESSALEHKSPPTIALRLHPPTVHCRNKVMALDDSTRFSTTQPVPL
jgi:hypothetical protein